MAIIRKPEVLQRAFNQILFRVSDETIQLALMYPNDPLKIVTLTGVQIDNALTLDVSGVVKYLFKDLRTALTTTSSSDWAFIDYNLQVDYRILNELFTALNAVAQPGRTGAIPAVQTTRIPKNNVYTIPKYEGYPVGICIANNPLYDAESSHIIIYGTISDSSDSTSIPNASIRLTNNDGSVVYGLGITDSMGQFTIDWSVLRSDFPTTLYYTVNATDHTSVSGSITTPTFDEAVNSGILINVGMSYTGSFITIRGTISGTDTNSASGTVTLADTDDLGHILVSIPVTDQTTSYLYSWKITQAEYDSYLSGFTLNLNLPGYSANAVNYSNNYAVAVSNGITANFTVSKITVEATPNPVIFGESGGTQTITVTSDDPLTTITAVTSADTWISTDFSGNTVDVTLTATTAVRSGTITITANGSSIVVQVLQEITNPYIIVNPEASTIAWNNTSAITLNVQSNVDWQLDALPPAWLSVSPQTGSSGLTSVIVTPTTNTTTATRNTTVTFEEASGAPFDTYFIVQGSNYGLTIAGRVLDGDTGSAISNVRVQIAGNNSGLIANVYTNSVGAFSYEWMATQAIYEANTFLILTAVVDSDPGYSTETVHINLPTYATRAANPITNTFTLYNTNYININGSSLSTYNAFGVPETFTADVFSNAAWMVTYSENGGSITSVPPIWITGTPYAGTGNMLLSISLAANTTALRTCTIYFTLTDGTYARLNIIQQVSAQKNVILRMQMQPATSSGVTLPAEGDGLVRVYNTGINPISPNLIGEFLGAPDPSDPSMPPVSNASVMIMGLTEAKWNARATSFTLTLIDEIGGSDAGGTGSFTVNATYAQLVAAMDLPQPGYHVGTVIIV